jgi:RNA polymerase sigma-70 factor, ECF subfamily
MPSVLEGAIAAGRAAWPGIDVPDEAFATFLAAKGDPAALCVADLYLACACAEGIAAALATFDRACLPVVERAVAAIGVTAAERADLCQIVRQRLLVARAGRAARISSYSGRGSLAAWVRVVATREAVRLLRKERREVQAHDDELAGMLNPVAGPELAYLKRLYREEFRAAFREAVDALSDRERMLLRQHVLDGLSIDRLAAFYRVHRTTTARWIEAARDAVVSGTRRALTGRLRLRPGELDSIIRLIHSELDVSLHAALAERP